jgi:cbb3-type cytochrome oxidase subunit 3
MFKHYFEQMEGVSIYPIFSLMVFFLFFLGLGVYVYFLDRKKREHLENLPLED